MNQKVTVVVPTFNRGHLLEETIPAYLQPEVLEIIVIDDASTDNTGYVLEKLQQKYPGRIRHCTNKKNIKQVASKNIGKSLAQTEWIYFGDDDSILTEGSIKKLLESAEQNNADIVGAVPLYCQIGESPLDAIAKYMSRPFSSDDKRFVDLKILRFDFTSLRPEKDIAIPVTQACFLIRQNWFRRVDFDEIYTANCFREETDYLLSCHRLGAKIFFSGGALQINLPPDMATGGARSGSRLRYEIYSLINTARFLRKHRAFFVEDIKVKSIYHPLLSYLTERVFAAAKKIIK